ncbi:DNA starvation/stationary phase protection protein Dps [Aquimarina algicola]|uniref:DNA starvation/stationary phase protection protein Dps n=1 Tax=Aquimarina algicola TaxID=2589995 RepID=A0A504JF43_9FLAO|nr:DNA starvation/stationary phase protection protein Dps [Aquimarina algicola]TPN87085.1 DNA starvation/stationary phase protection protein Dps [Aquimarina algicola]
MIKYKSTIRVEHKDEIISILNQQLADTFDLYSQLKQAHWNVKGLQFYALHLLFDDLAKEILDHIDNIAERVVSLGGIAKGTLRMAAKTSRLPHSPETFDSGEFTIKKLVERYNTICESTRVAIESICLLGDKATADLFTGVVRGLDKSLWMLQSHLL